MELQSNYSKSYINIARPWGSIRHAFEVEFDSLYTKNRKNSRYQITNFPKLWSLFLLHTKELLSYGNISQIAGKIFTTQCSFTDCLKYKIENYTICPQQILANTNDISWRAFPLLLLSLRLSGFFDISGKLFFN